eukprot:scaffold11559_cov128-Isochrysis_galbana.AAC.3
MRGEDTPVRGEGTPSPRRGRNDEERLRRSRAHALTLTRSLAHSSLVTHSPLTLRTPPRAACAATPPPPPTTAAGRALLHMVGPRGRPAAPTRGSVVNTLPGPGRVLALS